MHINIDSSTFEIFVAAGEIAHFARTKSSSRKNMFFREGPDAPAFDGEFRRELSLRVNTGGLDFTVTGLCDILWSFGGVWTMEKIKEKGRVSSKTSPASDSEFLAECVLSAYMLASEKDLDKVNVRMTYMKSGSGDLRTFECIFERPFLEKMAAALFERAAPFIAHEAKRLLTTVPALKDLPFPYKELRDAQRDFISDAYRAMKSGTRLLVSAPTGIGKTVSALYPALRAIGSGDIDRVFYLTAKTVTGKACADAVARMAQSAEGLRCAYVIAKERTCPFVHVKKEAGVSRCRICPLMGEVDRISYEERRDSALLELLSDGSVLDPATVQAAAKRHSLCPYELSLDASEHCEVIICDYNYVFDPSVRFKRYFGAVRESYAFLIDEAHNLPDRAREMYSATLDARLFLKLFKTEAPVITKNTALLDSIGEVVKKIREVMALCKSEEHLDSAGESVGYYLSQRMIDGLPEAIGSFCRNAYTASKEEEAAVILEEAYEAAAEFYRAVSLFDRGFAFYAELQGPSLKLEIRCLDPSPMLENMLMAAKSTVMFSATLTPMDYFADVLGCRKAARLELDSPYDPKNLCLFAYDSVSTRYNDREMSVPDICEVIMAVTEAREGNYIVYFPSYEYMMMVYEEFSECAPHIRTVVQTPKMTHRDREAFLSEFSRPDGEGLCGFCVLGGAFSEGVDLRGESLIGTIIIGTGLPKITAEQNILADYFEKTREGGQDYAYTYPAMIKVLQAAGRVIRSEEDRGVVVLLDDRYSDPNIYRLFPKSWRHIKYTGDPYSLSAAIEKFWYEE